MNANPRVLLIAVFVALASWTHLARCQIFFPDGTDYVNYVPYVPGTPNGRIYIGEFTGDAKCHFRANVPAGKTVTDAKIFTVKDPFGGSEHTAVGHLVNGSGKVISFGKLAFKKVDAKGNPCTETARVTKAAPSPLEEPTTISVSNDADSLAITCDGRFAVVVGANSATPVSLVDLDAGAEVDKFAADSNATFAATFDDGESVIVIVNIPPLNDTNLLRRLKIVDGKLVDTGESLAAGPAGTSRRFKKVFAVRGSKVGVALAEFGTPQLVTFRIPGLQVLDSIDTGFRDSGAVNCEGDRVYLRGGSQIDGYTIDRVTGALGATAFLTMNNVGQTDPFVTNFGNALEISHDGTLLIVPEGTAFPNSPPTPRLTSFDATTGERVGFFDAFDGGSPTLVSTYPCCAETGSRLSIRQLTSGAIQILATGVPDQKYELQKSQNLVDWDKLLEFQMTASPAPYIDPDSQSSSSRFYRLKLLP